jgi:CDP-diacylglycerol--glycerol-3-phosphate 3-phosphatidyltransferase
MQSSTSASDSTPPKVEGAESRPEVTQPPAPGPVLSIPVSRLTLANKITIIRILLIPVFVMFAVYYVRDLQEWQRWAAIAVFLTAAITDGVDGYVARRFSQKSRLGTLLDPLADKLLLVSALVLLSIDNGEAFDRLPLWFPVLIISRDLFLLGGAIVLQFMHGNFVGCPRVVGKIATVCQMITLGWVLLKIGHPSFHYPLYAAGLFTFLSVIWYTYDGIRALSGHVRPTKITRPF